eukprot:8514650-Ditylum_brightwellii.AAC.1
MRLGWVRPPKCTHCAYNSMTRRPRGGKQTLMTCHKIKPALHPGKLIIKRYKTATIFVDHYSRLTYVHLQYDLSFQQTWEANRAFEIWSARIRVKIEHYHANNGQFADKAFIKDCERNRQMLTFCTAI